MKKFMANETLGLFSFLMFSGNLLLAAKLSTFTPDLRGRGLKKVFIVRFFKILQFVLDDPSEFGPGQPDPGLN
jgi:hypothetical protein